MPLPADLYRRLRGVLLRCSQFGSDPALHDMFVASELAPFGDDLPKAETKSSRVDACMAYLLGKCLSDGRPALPLFLSALRDRYVEGDALRDELEQLVEQFRSVDLSCDSRPGSDLSRTGRAFVGYEYFPFQAIDSPEVFVGRETEIAQLRESLLSGNSIVVIRSGVGGIGKTALAAYAAHQLRSEFSEGVLWARLDTEDTLSILASFIAAFGKESASWLKYLTTVDARSKYYRSLSDRRCLVVLDNAESAEQVIPLLPSGIASKVLITTRYALSSGLPDRYELHLGSLSDRAAVALLSELLHSPVDGTLGETAVRLCNALGNLPLAIRIAAAIIQEFGWGPQDYLDRLRNASPLDWLTDSEEDQGVRSSFAISYNSLPDETSKRAFRVLGIFPSSAFRSAVLAHVLGIDAVETDRRLLTLIRRYTCLRYVVNT